MTKFSCSRCGKCCMSLGRHIQVIRTTSPRSFLISVRVTRETLPVQIVPSLVPLYSQKDPPAWEAGWCPFLRREADGLFACTIYPFRPRICREFRCMTMRILDRSGREAGRVKGRASLVSGDPRLVQLWNDAVAPLAGLPEKEFASRCRGILASHGFDVEIFDE
ncbi:MAG: YkgJ family cysteine cluster protein [Methanolinea sp.]|nr:YkgJ family cysteine cluster protein [Methanolinea sp.]